MKVVVGLDLSLTETGIAALNDSRKARVGTIKSKAQKEPTVADRRTRLLGIKRSVLDVVRMADLVVLEQPAFNATGGSHHDRSGIWWLIVDSILGACIPLVEVTPGQLKKYATGSGGSSKDRVLAAVVRRYPNVDVTNNNEADAWVLAAMGARHLGFPIEASLPAKNLEPMTSVRWP